MKSAVQRNLIKRICREVFRLLRQQTFPFDLIIRLNFKLPVIERNKIADEVKSLLAKLNSLGHTGQQCRREARES